RLKFLGVSKICIEQELSLTAKEIYQKYANSESIDMLAITIEKRERLKQKVKELIQEIEK
ncbi:MAG: hypothetical protein N2380_01865, partial [bacterium]|nr:hypothetical protein [bacterium]